MTRVLVTGASGFVGRQVTCSVVSSLLANQRVEVTPGTQRRDFRHMSDVGGALVGLLDSPVAGPVNIRSGVAVPVRSILDHSGPLLGRPERLEVGARRKEHRVPPLVVAHVGRLEREVGRSLRFDLEATLERTLGWWSKKPTVERV